ncbi:MAG: chaperone modulator CbpM [Alphaproteobacteria bacterium]
MPFSFDEILERARIDRRTLTLWIEEGWVTPARDGDAYAFEDVDAARVGFIVELTRELAIGEEAVPVVLSLVDQLNVLHVTFRRVAAAVDDLPEPARSNLAAILADVDQG